MDPLGHSHRPRPLAPAVDPSPGEGFLVEPDCRVGRDCSCIEDELQRRSGHGAVRVGVGRTPVDVEDATDLHVQAGLLGQFAGRAGRRVLVVVECSSGQQPPVAVAGLQQEHASGLVGQQGGGADVVAGERREPVRVRQPGGIRRPRARDGVLRRRRLDRCGSTVRGLDVVGLRGVAHVTGSSPQWCPDRRRGRCTSSLTAAVPRRQGARWRARARPHVERTGSRSHPTQVEPLARDRRSNGANVFI